MLKPCIECGIPTTGTRCEPCQGARPPRVRTDQHAQRSDRWRRLSARLRRLSAFCEHCGAGRDLTVDHRVPLSRGGAEWDPANLRVLCRPCHGRAWASQRAGPSA